MAGTDELETWQNTGRGRIVMRRFDGREEVVTTIHGGKTFHLRPEDRQRFSNECASADADPFSNGTCAPIRLVGSEEEVAELTSNPNALTSSQLGELLKAPTKTFDARLAEMTNVVALTRLLETAREQDVPVKRVNAIQARMHQINPPPPESEIGGEKIPPPQSSDFRHMAPPTTPAGSGS